MKPHALTLCVLCCLQGSTSGEQAAERATLGVDDRTGTATEIRLKKKHPFVAWTAEEVAGFKERLADTSGQFKGTRYGWNHPRVGPVVKAEQGDPVACGKVWAVTGDKAKARSAADVLLTKSRDYSEEGFLKKGKWRAPMELEKQTLAYDLIADGGILRPEERQTIEAYLSQCLHALKKIKPQYAMCHNIGTHIDQGAWTAALCLEDQAMLRELFSRFKANIGKGLLPGGYWYEGTAYASMVRNNCARIIERARRSGVELAFLNCKRAALSDAWTVKAGYVQAAELFEWSARLMTPTCHVPNMGDGLDELRIFRPGFRHNVNCRERTFFDRLYRWGLAARSFMDPHVWGDFPPNPDVEPLDRLPDVAMPDAGIFVFRSGTGLDENDQYVMLLAMPRTGYHPHADQGHVNIMRYGRWLTRDLASSIDPPRFKGGYAPLRGALSVPRWGHNTVVVDGKWGKSNVGFPQVHYASPLNPDATVKVADVTISDFAEGPTAHQRRKILVTDDYIVLTDDIWLEDEGPSVSFDWFFHGVNNATWELETPSGEQVEPFLDYVPQHSKPDHNLIWREAHATEAPWRGRFVVDEKEQVGLRVWQLDVTNGAYCAGDFTPPRHKIPGIYTEGERVRLICQRKQGREAHFAAVFEPYKGSPRIQTIALTANTPQERVIEIGLVNGKRQRVLIGDGRYAVERR